VASKETLLKKQSMNFRILLTTFFALMFGHTFAQAFNYPAIKMNGKSVNDFVPTGWTILKSAEGDLNNDKAADFAFILQHNDSVTIIKHDSDFNPNYNDTSIFQPRILCIAFYDPITKQYDLKEQSDSFILCHDQQNMEDPFQDISISKGVLKIDFFIFMNWGGWGMSNNSYKFRFMNNDFYLIGADYNYLDRGSGESEDRSYNFLTKKVKIAKGKGPSDKVRIIWRTFSVKELKTFETFQQPFTWEIEKDFFI
jgi:hypothetical protein